MADGGLTAGQVYYIVTRRAAKAGVGRDVGPHDLRHTAITAARVAGASPDALMDFAHHESYDTTRQYIAQADRLLNPVCDLVERWRRS